MRGLAVIAVLLYHADTLPGGFLGVEVFFVISGFLITLLLVEEYRRRGHIALVAFWSRRARRLVPGLLLVVLATLALSALIQPTELAQLRAAAVAGLLWVSNWYFIVHQQSYFESVGRPPLLRHLWSLGIEAQFYLVWPPLLLLALRRWRPRQVMIGALVGAAASAMLMAVLAQPGADPSRVYYGTDTRASGLLLGAALALGAWRTERVPAWLLDGVGLATLGALACLAIGVDEFAPWLYRGGFVAVGVLSAMVIGATTDARASISRYVLRGRVLQWVGVRSYGIYLWHFPIFMVTRPELDVPLDGWLLLLLRGVVVAIVADLSYRYVELPARSATTWVRGWRSRRRVVVAGGVLLGIALLGTTAAAAKPPERPAYLAVDAVDTWLSTAAMIEPEPPPDEPALVVPPPIENIVASEAATPEPAPVVLSPTAAALRVTAIGDSVMLGAVDALQRAIEGIEVDAALNRQMADALNILRQRASSSQLGDVVVVHIGTNGSVTGAQLDELMQILNGVTRVVLVNDKVARAWEGPNNTVMTDGIQRYPNAVLVDWHAASGGQPLLFWDDGIHLRPAGAAFYAALIATRVQR